MELHEEKIVTSQRKLKFFFNQLCNYDYHGVHGENVIFLKMYEISVFNKTF